MPSFQEELVAGTVGGCLGISVVYPLDTVKSRLQTSGSRYTGMTHVLKSMARKEGLLSWYRGLLSPVAGYGTMFAVSFAAYGMGGRYLLSRRGASDGAGAGAGGDALALWEKSAAGFFSGVANSPFRAVFERVKSVMQVRQGTKGASPYSWSGACAVDLVRREGVVMGLFRGMNSTTLRESIQQAIYFPTYDVAKNYLIPTETEGETHSPTLPLPEPVLQMLAGGIAGCASWVPPVYFLDVIKTRMQTAEPGVYNSLWDCFRKTVRSEGVPVLFRGVGPALLRAFPLHALVFLGYETTISFIGAR